MCNALDAELGLTGTGIKYVHTYAPRAGMTMCVACPAGKIPNTGATGCDNCAAGTYRAASTISDECATCTEGNEAGPSGHQACTLW